MAEEREVWAFTENDMDLRLVRCEKEPWCFDGDPAWRPVANPPRTGCLVETQTCWFTREEALAALEESLAHDLRSYQRALERVQTERRASATTT